MLIPSPLPNSDPVQHSNAELESTVRRLIEGIILEKDEFDVRDALPNVVPDPSSLELNSEYSCPVGKVCTRQRRFSWARLCDV